jgi:hypothetical protein
LDNSINIYIYIHDEIIVKLFATDHIWS